MYILQTHCVGLVAEAPVSLKNVGEVATLNIISSLKKWNYC